MTKDTTPPPETHPGVRCDRCEGSGSIIGYDKVEITDHSVRVSGWHDIKCPACHGTGKQRG